MHRRVLPRPLRVVGEGGEAHSLRPRLLLLLLHLGSPCQVATTMRRGPLPIPIPTPKVARAPKVATTSTASMTPTPGRPTRLRRVA
jgi:hypothetical protein